MNPTEKTLKAVRLIARDILSFEDLDIQFGDPITLVRAHNAAGKSNLTNLLLSFVDEKATDATLLRAGAEKGEAVLILSEGGARWTIEQTVDEGGAIKRKAVRPDNSKEPRFREFVRSIANAMSVNPIKFVQAEPSTRARIFIEQSDARLTPADLQAAGVTDYLQADLNQHGLAALDAIRKHVRNKREGVGGAMAHLKGAIIKLKEALPADTENPPTESEREELLRDHLDKSLAVRNFQASMKLKWAQRAEEIRQPFRAERQEAERQITELRQKLADLQTVEERAVSQAAQEFNADQQRELMVLTIEQNTAQDRVNRLDDRLQEYARTRQTRSNIETYQVEVEEKQREWDRLQAQMRALDRLEADMLKNLPIPSVKPINGELYDRDGVPFPRWNEQRQWALAFQIAKTRAGRWPFCVVDGIQFLDPRNKEKFLEAAKNSGMQFLLTEVNTLCSCGHPHEVHEPAGYNEPSCLVVNCDCQGFVDPGMVVERIGDVPTVAAREQRRKK